MCCSRNTFAFLGAECRSAGVLHADGALEDQPREFREFTALDGDGSLVSFSQAIEQG